MAADGGNRLHDQWRLYRALGRVPAGRTYLGKLLAVSALALALPAAALGVVIWFGMPLDGAFLLLVLGLCWVVGLALCWLGFGALLQPLEATDRAMTRFVESGEVPEFDSGFSDLVGRLMANTRRGLALLDQSRRQAAVDHTTDPLTGLINRRSAYRRLGADLLRSSRDQKPVCVALIEIDHLDRLIERLGHDSADVIVKAVARVVIGEIRRSDWVASYGNNQFLAGLWGVDEVAAGIALRRVAAQLKANPRHPVTLSIGLTRAGVRDRPDDVVAAAASATARARREGGDRLVVDSSSPG